MIVRSLGRRYRMPPWECGRLPLSVAFALLDDPDPSDPHRGQEPIGSEEQFRQMLEDEGFDVMG